MENKICKSRINKIKKEFRKELNVETMNISYLSFEERIKFIKKNINNKKLFMFIFNEDRELKHINYMSKKNYDFVIANKDTTFGINLNQIDECIKYFKCIFNKDDDNCLICYE